MLSQEKFNSLANSARSSLDPAKILDPVKMADDDPVTADIKQETPEYLKEVDDVKFLNISVKGYEKKTVSSGFTKDEYYAYRIVSM